MNKNIPMKNPFQKNDHKLLITGIVIGAAAAGAAAYLFLTEKGTTLRGELREKFSKLFGGDAEPEMQEDPQAYLHQKNKAPKTDREALKKHAILHDSEQHGEQQS